MNEVPALREMKIEVTYRCPLTCVHCSSDAFPDSPWEISQARCLEMIRQAKTLGLEELALSGGEPLLWPGLEEAICLARDLDITTTIYTSGNVDDVQYRLDMLAGLGLRRAVFSIFGGSEVPHEGITRRRGSFQRTVDAAIAARRVGLETGLHFVAMRRNYRELEGVVAVGNRVGAGTVSVLRFVPQGRGSLLRGEALDRLQSLELKRIIERLRNDGNNIRTGSPMNVLWLNEVPECLSGTDRLIVGADLKIHPCDAFKQLPTEQVVGTSDYSSLENASLTDCWVHSPYLMAVRASVEGERDEPCRSCDSLNRCGSGCLAQKVLEDGMLHAGPDPACLMGNGHDLQEGKVNDAAVNQ